MTATETLSVGEQRRPYCHACNESWDWDGVGSAPMSATCTRCRTARADQAWQRVCPPDSIFRTTDPARLPAQPYATVKNWQWGPRGIVASGPPRRGKTRSIYLLLHRLIREGRSVEAYDSLGYQHAVSSKFREGDGERWAESLAKVDVLFLDDVDKMKFTDRMATEFFGLLDRRSVRQKPTFITTNATGESLKAKLPAEVQDAIVERIREFFIPVQF